MFVVRSRAQRTQRGGAYADARSFSELCAHTRGVLAEGGDDAFRTDPPIELTRQLLYFVAHEATDAGRIGEIREVFGLNDNAPNAAELAHAQGSLTGHNRALLATVAVAIKEDLMRVKDSLDLHLRTPNAASSDLNSHHQILGRNLILHHYT